LHLMSLITKSGKKLARGFANKPGEKPDQVWDEMDELGTGSKKYITTRQEALVNQTASDQGLSTRENKEGPDRESIQLVHCPDLQVANQIVRDVKKIGKN